MSLDFVVWAAYAGMHALGARNITCAQASMTCCSPCSVANVKHHRCYPTWILSSVTGFGMRTIGPLGIGLRLCHQQ